MESLVSGEIDRFVAELKVFMDHGIHKYFVILTGYDIYLIPIIVSYLLFVTKLGPAYMKNRQAYDLKYVMRFYNLANLLINLGLLLLGIQITDYTRSFFNCNAVKHAYSPYLCDMILVSRVLDLIDTVFFILRKKYKQVTKLHVSHHTIVPLAIYTASWFGLSIHSGFLLMINTLIHVFMYAYYFLATFPSFNKYLWWKRYLTSIQILQFAISIVYYSLGSIIISNNCGKVNLTPSLVNLTLSLVMLVMFVSFYLHAYQSPSTPSIKQHSPSKITLIREDSKHESPNNRKNNNKTPKSTASSTQQQQRKAKKIKAK